MEQAQQFPIHNEQSEGNESMQVWPRELLEQVQTHVGCEEWDKVAGILQPYLEHNPYNGDYWGYYGMANEKLGRYEEAIAAYRKAIEYGSHGTAEVAYQLGRRLALAGKGDEALKWLEVSLHTALRMLKAAEQDNAWDGLRDDPGFQRLLPPSVAEDSDRVIGWQQDLRYLALRMEQAHYDLFGPTNTQALTSTKWQETIKRLERLIPTLKDHEIVTELMKIIVLADDGHTKLHPFDVQAGYLAQHEIVNLHIPVMFYAFQDGWFVRAATPHTIIKTITIRRWKRF